MPAAVNHVRDLGLPAIYLHTIAELLRARGVDDHGLLTQVGLDPERLKSRDVRVSMSQASEFVTRAVVESGEPGLGILVAGEMRLPLQGSLGIAAMNSRTLGEALDVMVRFLALRAPYIRVTREDDGSHTVLTVDSEVDLGPLRGFIMDAMLFSCVNMGTQLLGVPVPGARVRRRGREPAYFQRFHHRVPLPVDYESDSDAIVIPSSELATPIRFSDEQAAAVSREQCEQALRQLTEDAGFPARVRRVIETSYPFPPKLGRVAGILYVSERTLKRRLQEEDASFQSLVDEVRLDRARGLLRNTCMSLSQIADVLGYADAANFTRAFKRWTDLSPSAYRSGQRALSRAS
ncbi:AraC family transcriptional regulator [Tamilnaduibacter salinus]|uniref:AraC family transcriptional regulator n=1 Tax=Tamilnaduibacter salinus TaxID=1484056 RepID=A0A2A2I396_9GAMM|nr:AraC family transcriptional regulator [Tamilnaduibacter salinus]PAV25513.1 AraC family transcriptional regulator [Tamilnaduibacter salinus]PVY77340.1 AraC family transcriptional regulator [Tamilnaduibacter salinus]